MWRATPFLAPLAAACVGRGSQHAFWLFPTNLVPQATGKPSLRARFGGWLHGVEAFDASLFSLAANELKLMDPQQRLLLEVSWEVLCSGRDMPAPAGAVGKWPICFRHSAAPGMCMVAPYPRTPMRPMAPPSGASQPARSILAPPICVAGHTTTPATAVFVGIQQMEYGGLAAAHGAALGAYSGEAARFSQAVHCSQSNCGPAWLTSAECAPPSPFPPL